LDKWQRINYQPNIKLDRVGVTASEEHINLSKDAAKEGMVLLKNRGNTLPLKKGCRVALFGKAGFDYVKGGGGAGDVTVSYTTNIYEGIKKLPDWITVNEDLSDFYRDHVNNEYKEGKDPGFVTEPEIPDALVKKVRANTETAIISICRYSGEGWDRKSSNDQNDAQAEKWVGDTAGAYNDLFEDGDFYLNHSEKEMISTVKRSFPRVIVLMNVGGMVDSEWFASDDNIQSVLMVWQGGIEGGSAAAELLCGIGNPSGKLVDTFAKDLEDYPSTYNFHDSRVYVDYTDDIYVGYRYFETIPGAHKRVNYPFGFGLSYTFFDISHIKTNIGDDRVTIEVIVSNRGDVDGREVIQLYSMEPKGQLGKSSKRLIAFKKTRQLKRGESEHITFSFPISDLAAYDDTGKIAKSAYILEKGEYKFFLGNSVRDGVILNDSYLVTADRVVKQLSEKLTPQLLGKRLFSDGSFESLPVKAVNSENMGLDLGEPDLITPAVRYVESYKLTHLENVMTLENVYKGDISLENFIDILSDDDLAHMLGGQPNTGVSNTFGWGNLPQYGIPNAPTADGPAGLRIEKKCGVFTTAWPCATLLASTWDEEILFKVGEAGAKEVKENNIAVWLTPAVNIHRSPLCGRNFEYYSEDPLITGKLAAAMVRGIQTVGIAATVKHFAFNNKETNRKNSDSRVSERAAREIYLKAFEIIVKESDPYAIMTAYNLVNGQRTSECKELLQDILRDEWGFSGVVTTDWWTNSEHSKEILAGNDIKMACGDPENLKKALQESVISRKDLERSAKRVLELLLKID
jgi:beta-glucosidase